MDYSYSPFKDFQGDEFRCLVRSGRRYRDHTKRGRMGQAFRSLRSYPFLVYSYPVPDDWVKCPAVKDHRRPDTTIYSLYPEGLFRITDPHCRVYICGLCKQGRLDYCCKQRLSLKGKGSRRYTPPWKEKVCGPERMEKDALHG